MIFCHASYNLPLYLFAESILHYCNSRATEVLQQLGDRQHHFNTVINMAILGYSKDILSETIYLHTIFRLDKEAFLKPLA
jgi:hypothetical protein